MAADKLWSVVRGGLLVTVCSMMLYVNTVTDIAPSPEYAVDLQPPPPQELYISQEQLQQFLYQQQLIEDQKHIQLQRMRRQQQLLLQQQEANGQLTTPPPPTQIELSLEQREELRQLLLRSFEQQLDREQEKQTSREQQLLQNVQNQADRDQQQQKKDPSRDQQRQQQRQLRKQRLEKQQRLLLKQDEEEEQRQQRRQRQQQAVATNTTQRKPPTSVRDLFRTPSCVDPPFTCPHPRIQFYLYTRSMQSNPELLNVLSPASLAGSRFRKQHPTKIIIHGFGGGRNLSPSTDLRRAYFTRGEYNIIIVDYSTLVVEPCLSQIQWSPRFCAECIAQLVNYLNDNPRGTTPDKLHLLGYSMGAHIAGLVANHVERGKLGRITGLDPTIIFYMGSNKSRDLDASDAHFVDVIHTGAGILGQWGPNGHVDYYVNGGTSQPGCQQDSLLKTLSCDHTKVTPYYIESINSKAGFWASPCTNQVLYFLGFCQPNDEDYILMGEDAPRSARGLYYLTTNSRKPYAKGFPGRRRSVRRGNT